MFVFAEGKFEQPFQLGITIRGLQEDNKSSLVYSNAMHNRTRILKCSKVCFDLIFFHQPFCPSACLPACVLNLFLFDRSASR